ncbi:MAG: SPFH domain-containing protein [Bacilli bacterium]|nr:SPFH domain-containing protein [Bacilli bacterium]
MGLIKALTSAASNTLGDQFKEFVMCPDVDNDVIIQRGIVEHGPGNKNYSEGVISNGTAIAVPQGMAMMIVDNGAIREFTAEPGTYTWDSGSEPSIFVGGLGQGIVNTIKTIGNRFTYGGQPAKDQRVYYVNIKVIPGNTFGSAQPETVFDPVYGSVEITYNGEFNIKVDDPIILVNNVIGANPKDTLTFDDVFAQNGKNILKSTFAQRVSEAITNIMTINNISFNLIQSRKSEITDQMNQILDADWKEKYGIIVTDVSLRVNASEESRRIIREADADVSKTTRMGQVYSNNMKGTMAAATAEAMKNAASNENGAMAGFMGMGMAGMQGNNVMGTVMQGTNNANNQNVFDSMVGSAQSGSVCPKCGSPVNGKFCGNCGTTVGEEKVCPKCGAKSNPGANFCTQCGSSLK